MPTETEPEGGHPIRARRYVVTFDDLFRVPDNWLSWRCLLGWTQMAPGYVDGACKYDHNVDSWEQLDAETTSHLARWHPHVAALVDRADDVRRVEHMIAVAPADYPGLPGLRRYLDELRAEETTDTPPARVDFAREDCWCCEISWRLCRGLYDNGFARCCSDCTHNLTAAAPDPITEETTDHAQ